MLRGVDRKPLASIEGMRNLQRLLRPRNPKIGDVKVEDVIDNRIMRSSMKAVSSTGPTPPKAKH